MQLVQKIACAGTFLAAASFMAATPAKALLVQHNGNTIFSDSLQSYDVGTQPSATGWRIMTEARTPVPGGYTHGNIYDWTSDLGANVLVTDAGSPGAPTVLDGGPDGHTKYLHLSNISGGQDDRPFAFIEFDPISSGTIYFEFMLHETERRAQVQFGNGPFNDSSYTPNVRLTPDAGGAGGSGWDLNTPGITRTDMHSGGVTNDWYKVGVLYTFVNAGDDTVELFVDDVSSGVFSLAGATYNNAISSVVINHSHNTDGVIYVASTIPEPASLALLGIGGALMLRRRRTA